MKTRIISALVGTVILLAVLCCPWTWVFGVAVAALAVMAVWELLHNAGASPSRMLQIGSCLFAGLEVLLCYRYAYLQSLPAADATHEALLAGWAAVLFPAAYVIYVLVIWLCIYKKIYVASIGLTVMLTFYVTLGFSSMALLRMSDWVAGGFWNILLLLVIPWMNDTGAYFVGTFFGKHKMAPIISPKKSWEGFFGGWVISVGCAALLAVIYNMVMNAYGYVISPLLYAIVALILAPISVCGDLLASKIKRHYGIKDFSNIMPGHGGVMDRFDSVVIIAPLLYILLSGIPMLL